MKNNTARCGKSKLFLPFVSFLLLPVLLYTLLSGTTAVFAGASKVVICDDDSFQEEIDVGVWYTYSNVSHSDACIMFDETGTSASRIVARTRYNSYGEYMSECLDGEITFSISSLSESGEFIIAVGMPRASSEITVAGGASIYFTENAGMLQCGVRMNGEPENVIVQPQGFAGNSFGSAINVAFSLTTTGAFSLSVNDTSLCDSAEAGLPTTGYFGFGQRGVSAVAISHVQVIGYSYDRPQNTVTPGREELFLDFSGDCYNVNEWYSSMTGGYFQPSRLTVEDGALLFRNVGESYLSTTYQYSNFRLEFELPYIQRERVYSEQTGNLVMPVSSWFGISMGAPSTNGGSASGILSSAFLYFNPDRLDGQATKTYLYVQEYGTILQSFELPSELNLWNPEIEGAVGVKVVMLDGVVDVSVRINGVDAVNADEDGYTQIASYDLTYTPLGYIQIWGMGHPHGSGLSMAESGQINSITQANFSIDNIHIKNLDTDAVTIETDFRTNRQDNVPDYIYSDTWDEQDLLNSILQNGSPGNNLPLVIGLSVGGGVLAIGAAVTAFVLIRRKKKND